jgi:hypothetical protein
VRDDCVAAEIAYDRAAPMFMISTQSEESHRSWGLWQFWIFGILAVLLATIAGIVAVQHESDFQIIIGIPAMAGGIMLAIWGTGWLWMVYNSLIGLKNRVKMAAANIDIELKRRYDLIPQIVRIVEGMNQHERAVQETLALLRNQSGISTVENDTEAKGCANSLIALAESYPDLKSNEVFLSLHHNLTETEQRIALARQYYNDVIETHNNRCGRFPEKLIAIIAGLCFIPPFVAEDFVCDTVNVRLAS